MKKNTDILMQNKVFLWIAFATGLILLIPFLAMQVTTEVDWDARDFLTIAILLFTTGSMYVLAARRTLKHRVVLGIIFAAALLYIWAELAVGIFTNWGS
jgi:hypothetical protein